MKHERNVQNIGTSMFVHFNHRHYFTWKPLTDILQSEYVF